MVWRVTPKPSEHGLVAVMDSDARAWSVGM